VSAQKALLRLPLGRGLAQDQDARLVAPGSLGEAHNVVVDRAGRFTKRTGWGEMPRDDENGVELGAPDRVDPVGLELLQTTHSNGLVHSWGPGRQRWESVGWLPPFAVRSTPLARPASSIVTGVFATFGDDAKYELIVWQYGAGGGNFEAYSTLRDAETGAIIQRESAVYPAARLTYPIVLSIGTYAWIVYAGPDVRVKRFATSLTAPTSTLYGSSAVVFDACAVDGGTAAMVAWADLVSGDVTATLYDEDLGLITTVTFPGISPSDIAVCDGPPGQYLLAWTAGATGARVLHLEWLDSNFDINWSVDVETGCESITTPVLGVDHRGFVWVSWFGRLTSASTDEEGLHIRCVIAGVVQSWRRRTWRCSPLAFPQQTGQGLYLPVGVASATGLTDAHMALLQIDDDLSESPARYAGLLVRQTVGGATIAQRWVDRGETYELGAVVVTRPQLYGRDVNGIDRVTIDPSARPTLPAVRLPQQFIWGSNGLWSYDGYEVTEVGFLQPPELFQDPLAPFTRGGSPTFGDGTYIYRARYEAVDDAGVMHLSPWSNDLTVTTDSTPSPVSEILLKIRTTQITAHGRRQFRAVSIALYRSNTNGVVDGVGTLYRLTAYGAEALSMPMDVPFIDYTDDEVDATSEGLGFITTDGRLEARPAPPVLAMAVHAGRLWLASAEGDRRVWYSQSLQTDEMPQFHEQLSVQLTDSEERVTGLASVEGQLLIYSREAAYTISGTGPTDTGQVGGFDGPFRVSSFGCIDPGSVVVTSRGAYARSAAGIVLHSRDNLAASVVSDPVRDLLEEPDAEILHAVYHEADARVVWHLWLPEFGRSVLLIYDERQGCWTTADSAEVDEITHLAYDREAKALAFAGPFSVLREGYGGLAFDGDPTDPTWYTVEIRSPWLRAGEVGGWSQIELVHLEGEACTPGTWQLESRFDYNETSSHASTIDLTAKVRGDRIVKQIGLRQQTCTALQLALVEQTAGSLPIDQENPGGVRWWGLTLEASLRPGLARIDVTNRGGMS
jgi:hypothetical protein